MYVANYTILYINYIYTCFVHVYFCIYIYCKSGVGSSEMLIISLVSTKLPKKLRLFSLAIRIKNNIYYGQPNIQNYLAIGQVKKNYTVNSRYLELSTRDQQICSRVRLYRVVILCKLIRMGPIVLFETSRVRLVEYSRYRDLIHITSSNL